MGRIPGFTIIELTSAMAAGAIIVLALGSILVISSDESTTTSSRVQVQRDMMILDDYIQNRLTYTINDSLLIYADSSAEASGTPLSIGLTGTVLKTKDIYGNTYRITESNQELLWEIGSTSLNLIDTDVLSLTFRGINTDYSTQLDIDLQVEALEDTFYYDWSISLRN